MRILLLWCALAVALTGRAGVNVRDFGAKGDGVADDTAAIRAAFAEAAKQTAAKRVRVGHRCTGGGVGDGPVSAVFFPKGVYRVSDTIVAVRDIVLNGADGAELVMPDPAKDVLYFNSAFRCRVTGLAFRGGATQLRFWTQNNDTANITVRNCRFRNSSAPAVECRSYSYKTNGQTRTLAPYLMRDGKLVRNPAYDGPRKGFYNSTLLTVEECAFADCRPALDCASDGVVVRNCTFLSAPHTEGGVLRLGSRAHAYGLDIMVRRDPKLRQSAFVVRGTCIDITDCRIRTDTGKGVCTVRSSSVPGYIGSSVNLENLTVESGKDDDNVPLVIEKGTSPNVIRVAGLEEKGVRHPNPVHYAGGRDEKVLADLRRFKGFSVERSYSTEVSETARRYPVLPTVPVRDAGEIVLCATDFGVDEDVRTDDTAAMKKLFADAAGESNVRIVLPDTWIDLSETIDVPDGVTVTAAGTAGVRMKDETKDAFCANAFSDVRFSNILFEGGRRAIVLRTAERGVLKRLFGRGKAFASVTDCFFGDLASYAVEAVSGDGTEDRRGDFDLVMSGGVAFTCKIYRGNGTAWDDRRWTEILPEATGKLSGSVAWENRGLLVMRDMLGVPMQVGGMIKMSEVPVFEEVEVGEFRWVDNFGDFVSLYNRYGGEYGGVTPVYNYGQGRVLIDGGYAWFENRMARQYPVVADSPSAELRLDGVTFSPNLRSNPIEFVWKDAVGSVRPTDGQKISCYFPLNEKEK